MDSKTLIDHLPFGLIELDEAGTVIYYKAKNDGVSTDSETEIVGRNFFTDIRPIAEAREFQDHIKSFKQGHAPAVNFNFTFGSEHAWLPVRVLLARINEQSELGGVESILVHIKAQTG